MRVSVSEILIGRAQNDAAPENGPVTHVDPVAWRQRPDQAPRKRVAEHVDDEAGAGTPPARRRAGVWLVFQRGSVGGLIMWVLGPLREETLKATDGLRV